MLLPLTSPPPTHLPSAPPPPQHAIVITQPEASCPLMLALERQAAAKATLRKLSERQAEERTAAEVVRQAAEEAAAAKAVEQAGGEGASRVHTRSATAAQRAAQQAAADAAAEARQQLKQKQAEERKPAEAAAKEADALLKAFLKGWRDSFLPQLMAAELAPAQDELVSAFARAHASKVLAPLLKVGGLGWWAAGTGGWLAVPARGAVWEQDHGPQLQLAVSLHSLVASDLHLPAHAYQQDRERRQAVQSRGCRPDAFVVPPVFPLQAGQGAAAGGAAVGAGSRRCPPAVDPAGSARVFYGRSQPARRCAQPASRAGAAAGAHGGGHQPARRARRLAADAQGEWLGVEGRGGTEKGARAAQLSAGVLLTYVPTYRKPATHSV